MLIERTKNATRNIVFGIFLKIYQIVLPFLMRTIMIYFMGIQYLGLNSLFASILQVLNLAELGVGSAMVFSMYKPIAEDDEEKICALLHLYKRYYHYIGTIIAVFGFIFTPFIPYLVKADLPANLNIYILYLLNLCATILSYWLFAYKNSLFQAHQRLDIVSKISLCTTTLQYILQIITIIWLKNYYVYIIISLVSQILTNIITAIKANKLYPKYKAKGKINIKEIKKINRHIKDLFTAKVGGVVLNSADTIVISSFLGLSTLAIYQNYFFILSSIIGIITVVFNSCMAGIGNSIITESEEKNYLDFRKFMYIIFWVGGWCTICLLCLYQPFMEIWVGKDYLLSISIVCLLCLYFYIYEINQLLNIYKDASGIWHKDRYRPMITAFVNLSLNIFLVNYFGLYGVVLSTIIAMIFIGMPWLISNLFTTLFNIKHLHSFLKQIVFYTFTVLLCCILTYFMCYYIPKSNLYLLLLVRAIICLIIPNVFFYFVTRKTVEYSLCKKLLLRILKR